MQCSKTLFFLMLVRKCEVLFHIYGILFIIWELFFHEYGMHSTFFSKVCQFHKMFLECALPTRVATLKSDFEAESLILLCNPSPFRFLFNESFHWKMFFLLSLWVIFICVTCPVPIISNTPWNIDCATALLISNMQSPYSSNFTL